MGLPRRRRASPGPRSDGGFSHDEYAALLLGVAVPCRSSWIQAARWDEAAANLTLTVDGNDYDFPGVDAGEAETFAYYLSKGSWYWLVWVRRMGRSAPAGVPQPGSRAWEAGEGRRPPQRVPTAPWDR